jgi:hypothetical protein
MVITIYTTKTVHSLVNTSDRGKSFKKREGCKPAYLSSYFSFEIDDSKINSKWKTFVSNKIDKFLPNAQITKINLVSELYNYSINAKTSNCELIANLIANYILDKRKPLQIDNPNIETKFINQYKKRNNEN